VSHALFIWSLDKREKRAMKGREMPTKTGTALYDRFKGSRLSRRQMLLSAGKRNDREEKEVLPTQTYKSSERLRGIKKVEKGRCRNCYS